MRVLSCGCMPLNLSGVGEDVSVTTLSRYESAELWLYASQPFGGGGWGKMCQLLRMRVLSCGCMPLNLSGGGGGGGGGGEMCQLLHKVGMRVLVYLSASRERYVGVQSEPPPPLNIHICVSNDLPVYG